MLCPQCVELGNPMMGRFCNQKCFKRSWKEHKQYHDYYKTLIANPTPGRNIIQLKFQRKKMVVFYFGEVGGRVGRVMMTVQPSHHLFLHAI